jgi:hypothetical protein
MFIPRHIRIEQNMDIIVKLKCINQRCLHNLMVCALSQEDRKPECNLKYITIDENGVCRDKFEAKVD